MILRILFLCVLMAPFLAEAKVVKSSFAIVVDRESYRQARAEIEGYAAAIERQGLKTRIIPDEWQHPDSIRLQLKQLWKSEDYPLEGAVFIGEIPVPMLRDAQHLTSAFKMDQQRYPWYRSSVPSDRFYDDFDLQFDYLKQDSIYPLVHYYSLKAESPQQLDVDIYTARIKPPKGENSYELLRNYLRKVIAWKASPKKARQLLLFTGHGYNSQCPRSWMDEKIAVTQQFAYLAGQQNFLEYINFQDEEHIRFRLMAELAREDLDIALLHHHGGPRAQYLDGMPEVTSVQDQLFGIKYYLRSKLRDAGNDPAAREKRIADFTSSLGVPEAWFNGAFDPEQTALDSIYNHNLDIYLEDHGDYVSRVPFIMLDACFTGSFHLDEYLSGAYIFDEGKTLLVQANSVNVIQDKWSDEMAGLIGLGVRAGFWHQMNCLLETHLIGDPTFAFADFDKKINLNDRIVRNKRDRRFWNRQLGSPYADVQALAARMLFRISGRGMSDRLLEIFRTSPFYPVRMEALTLLRRCKDANFIEALNLGISDSYELIQRMSAVYMSETGEPAHVPYLIQALLRNNLSKRVSYNLRDAAGMFSKDLLLPEFEKQSTELPSHAFLEERVATLKNTIESNSARKMVDELLDPAVAEKEKFFNLKAFRNQTVHPFAGELMGFIDTTSSINLKLTGIEMLGWFNHSFRREEIRDFCVRELAEEGQPAEIRKELLKTINRIQ